LIPRRPVDQSPIVARTRVAASTGRHATPTSSQSDSVATAGPAQPAAVIGIAGTVEWTYGTAATSVGGRIR